MKKGFKLLFAYFCILIGSLILGTLGYALYLNILDFVAESQNSGLSFEYLKKSFFYMLTFCLIFICPFVCYYRNHHPHGFIQTTFYILICLLTWLILFPSANLIKNKFYDEKTEKQNLTKNVFRETNGHVYYFLRDFYEDPISENQTPAIVIDTKGDGSINFAEVTDSSDFELYEDAKPYREILIKKSFQENIPKLIDFNLVLRRADLALQKGWTFYLGFLTFAFALCALYGITNFFKWRLVSVIAMIFEFALILILNTIYFSQNLSSFIFSITNNKFFLFLQNYVDEPLLCLVNFVLGLIFTAIGIVHFAIQTKKGKKD